jgi:hypothetical protein
MSSKRVKKIAMPRPDLKKYSTLFPVSPLSPLKLIRSLIARGLLKDFSTWTTQKSCIITRRNRAWI